MRSCAARCVGKARGDPVKVFFATDIHGSEICWRKFLNAAAFYKADAVILGGDVTGKVMVPITEHNGYWQVVMGGGDGPPGDQGGARGGRAADPQPRLVPGRDAPR